MLKYIEHPVVQFILGGSILTGASYLSNRVNPFFASVLVSLPMEIVTLFVIKKYGNRREYTWNVILLSLASVVPLVFYYLIQPTTFLNTQMEILLSFFIWIMMAVVIYYCQK